jgi:chromosome partitioning protein
MTLVLAVVNQKGGVGKTTTTVNLSAGLAHLGLRVLIIDLDPQAHSTEHLGVSSKFSKTEGLYEAMSGQITLEDCILETSQQGLHIAPSHLKLGSFNQHRPENAQFALREIITDEVKENYDYVLIDCQPSLSILTLNALTAADKIILPVQAEFLALDGLSQLIMTFKEVKATLHPTLEILGVVLTMYDRRNRLSAEILKELEKTFGDDLFESLIPRSVRFAEAPSFGRSIFEYAPGTDAANSYLKLAKELVYKVEEIERKKLQEEAEQVEYEDMAEYR